MLTNEYQYRELLTAVREHIRSSQIKAALSVNSAVIQLYWNIGEMIAKNQALFEGRNKYIEQLAADIKSEFPDLPGFSKRNLFDIRRFYLFYSSDSVRQLVALKWDNLITAFHNNAPLLQTDATKISLRQLVALGESTDNQSLNSVQQLVALVPWGTIY